MFRLFLLFLSVSFFSPFALGFRQGTDDSSTYYECLWNRNELGARWVECNDAFHHYLPRPTRKKSGDKLRVGSYNILRTSEQKGKKNLDLTARMINSEWDLVALQELQPGRTNEIVDMHMEGQFIAPAYLELFLKLQDLDDSWGLILSPFAQGSDAELLGFLYRHSRVQPVESEYCKETTTEKPPYTDSFIFREINESGIESSQSDQPINTRDYVIAEQALACPLKVSELASKYFIKLPLTARFRAGDFETQMLSLHLSFRGIEEFDSNCMGLCQLQNIKLISALGGDENNAIARAVTETLQDKQTQALLAGTEVKIPDPEDRCQIDVKKLEANEEREQRRFEKCLERLQDQLDQIAASGLLPDSCRSAVAEIDDEATYSRCQEDYEEGRETAYRSFIKDFFKKVVFSQVERIKKASNENLTEYMEKVFGVDVVTGMFNVLGRDNIISKGEGREFARFFQLYSTLKASQEIRDIEQSKDIIIGGDFNLEKETEANKWHFHIWQYSLGLLGDAALYVDGRTSINKDQELSNNYDHFIFSPSETSECDPESVYILNFLTATLSDGFELGKAVQAEDYHFVMSDHLPIGMVCETR